MVYNIHNNKYMKKTHIIQILIVILIIPVITWAQSRGFTIDNPTRFQDLSQVVLAVINIVQILLIMATTLYLIYAGLMFVTAQGEPSKLVKARDALLWGLVGAALILAARVLVVTLQSSVNSILK
jgi:uncharacterized BrkB/YihY/UPF0761 family membrane protein